MTPFGGFGGFHCTVTDNPVPIWLAVKLGGSMPPGGASNVLTVVESLYVHPAAVHADTRKVWLVHAASPVTTVDSWVPE
jgi:hypothetical protein